MRRWRTHTASAYELVLFEAVVEDFERGVGFFLDDADDFL